MNAQSSRQAAQLGIELMTNILLVGLGGFIGSVARYKMGGWVLHLTVQQKFLFGTFAVNVAGCLIAGVLAGLIEKHGLFSAEADFLVYRLAGRVHHLSAFGLETISLLRRGEPWIAAAYIGASVLLGVVAVWLGIKIVYVLR